MYRFASRLLLAGTLVILLLGPLAACQSGSPRPGPNPTPQVSTTPEQLSPDQVQALAAALASSEPPTPAPLDLLPDATDVPPDAPAAAGTGAAPTAGGAQTGSPTASAPAMTETPEPTETPAPESLTPAPTPQNLSRTENFLILGTDTRDNMTAWRTDSIIIVTVDEAAGQVGVISVPRDLYVGIPGYGQERINAVDYIGERGHYPGGGPGLMSRVVQQTLGIPIQHWVRIKQDGLIKLVDALGGVIVKLDCPLYELTPNKSSPTGYEQFVLPAGSILVDGTTAKKFVTYRYMSSNFGREKRQQQLLWALRNRVLQGDVLPRLPQLWTALSDVFTTDMGLADIVRLASVGIRLKGQDIHAMAFSPEYLQNYTTSAGAEVLLLRNPANMRARIAKLFAAPPLGEVGKAAPGGCPRPPRGFPDLTPHSTATPPAS